MGLEIERKFLVVNDGWKTSVVRRVQIRDGLIANSKGHKARVRIADDVATIALKSRKRGLVRIEFEYGIPYSDAQEILRIMCDGNVIDEVRHFVRYASNIWQVDVYEGLLDGVILAEIELTDADQKLKLRHWIGEEVSAGRGPSCQSDALIARAEGDPSGYCRTLVRGTPAKIAMRTKVAGCDSPQSGVMYCWMGDG